LPRIVVKSQEIDPKHKLRCNKQSCQTQFGNLFYLDVIVDIFVVPLGGDFALDFLGLEAISVCENGARLATVTRKMESRSKLTPVLFHIAAAAVSRVRMQRAQRASGKLESGAATRDRDQKMDAPTSQAKERSETCVGHRTEERG